MPNALYFDEPFESNHWPEILDEIYVKQVYAPYIQQAQDKIAVDIGGNLGLTSHYFSKYFKHVYAYEPTQAHFDNFNSMLKHNKIENVTVIKEAVANKAGMEKFNLSQNQTMNSLNPLVNNTQKTEDVKVITMEDLFKNNKIDRIHLLKLDPEGQEGEILMGKPFESVADRIDNIIYEWHSWCPSNPNLINSALRDYGFKIWQLPTIATVFACEREEVKAK